MIQDLLKETLQKKKQQQQQQQQKKYEKQYKYHPTNLWAFLTQLKVSSL